jgi:hypothetical protein
VELYRQQWPGGSGTLEATYSPAVDPGGYHIDSISGTAYGQSVTLSDYDFVDNYFLPGGRRGNVIGFSFAVSPRQAYNIYEDFGILSNGGSAYACGGAPYCIIAGNPDNSGIVPTVTDPILQLTSLSITPIAAGVPEPSTWAMMILGFAGVGFLTYRGRKAAVA